MSFDQRAEIRWVEANAVPEQSGLALEVYLYFLCARWLNNDRLRSISGECELLAAEDRERIHR